MKDVEFSALADLDAIRAEGERARHSEDVLIDALRWLLGRAEDCYRCKKMEHPCVGHDAIARAEGK